MAPMKDSRATAPCGVLEAAESLSKQYAKHGIEGVRRGHSLILGDASLMLQAGIGYVRAHSAFRPEDEVFIQSHSGDVLGHMNQDGMTLIDKETGLVHANNVFAACPPQGSGY